MRRQNMMREEYSWNPSQEWSNSAAAAAALGILHLQVILGHRVIHKADETLTLTQGHLYLSGSVVDC